MYIDPTWIHAAALAPALIFGAAGVAKLKRPAEFQATLEAYAVLPSRLVGPVSWSLPVLEICIAAALLIPGSRAAAALGALALLGTFSAAIAWNLHLGRKDLDCGCLPGGAKLPLSGWLLIRNLLLACCVAPAAWIEASERHLTWLDAVTIVAAGVLLSAAYLMSGHLSSVRAAAGHGVMGA